MKKTILLILFIVFLSGVNSSFAQNTCKFNSKECFTKAGYPACRSRIDLDKYYEFLNGGKEELAEQILSDKKRCLILEGNDRVAVQYNDNNKVKIFFRGSNQSYWVLNEAVYSRGR